MLSPKCLACMSRKILVVEDDLLNRKLFREVLEFAEFVVRTEGNGAGVVSVAKDFHPDLITMDINLPGISGIKLISILQADPLLTKIPIIAITAYVGQGDENQIMAAGASGYLAKPISLALLVAAVRRLLNAVAKPVTRVL